MTTEPDVPTALAEIEVAQARLVAATAALTPQGSEPDPIVVSIGDAGDVIEGGAPAAFPVSLSRPSEDPTWVVFEAFSETAIKGVDFEDPGGRLLEIPPGVQSVDIVIETIDNDRRDGARRFRVELNSVEGAVLGNSVGTCSIIDDEEDLIPPLEQGLLFRFDEQIKAPVDFEPGRVASLVSLIGWVCFDKPAEAGKWEKLFGAASTDSLGQGGMGFGRVPNGNLEVWRVGSTGFVQTQVACPVGQYVPFYVEARAGGKLSAVVGGVLTEPKDLPDFLAAMNSEACVGAGWWNSQRVDPSSACYAIAGYSRPLSVDEREELHDEWYDGLLAIPDPPEPVDPPDPGNPPPSGGHEPTNPNALQITLRATMQQRHAWHAYIVGLGGTDTARASHAGIVKHWARFADAGVKGARLHAPNNRGKFVDSYKPTVDFMVSKGCDTWLWTGYTYRAGSNAERFAEDVAWCVARGMPVTHVCLQNEPDGHAGNAINWSTLVQEYRNLRTGLDRAGLQSVKIIALEWAHFSANADKEFDLLKAAGLIPNTVAMGAGHFYKDGPRSPGIDERWLAMALSVVSGETGNLGRPNAEARSVISAYGASIECTHIALGGNNQYLVKADGVGHPWYAGIKTAMAPLYRGTRFRTVTCSDRPQGLDAKVAERMIRTAGSYNPRVAATFGQRPDGRWLWRICNATTGSKDTASKYVDAAYKAVTEQLTLQMDELMGLDGSFELVRSTGGPVQTVPMRSGVVRLTLAPGETVSLVGGPAS